MRSLRISIEIGCVKNPNKNPVAEKAILEFENELLRYNSSGGAVTDLGLSIVTARLNSRIRASGLSSREIWTQRNQFTNEQIPVFDRDIILKQNKSRTENHSHSEKSKLKGEEPFTTTNNISVGDIVYLRSEKSKMKGRDRYLVVATEKPWCHVKKFTGSQLRATSYKVKLSECFKVQGENVNNLPRFQSDSEEIDNDETCDTEDVLLPINTENVVPPTVSVPDTLTRPAYEPETCQLDCADTIVETSPSAQEPTHEQSDDSRSVVDERPKRTRKTPNYLKDYVLS